MSSFWSRILVAVVLLPAVLELIWLGGWWLALLAAVAGYAATLLALAGAHLGGAPWALAGALTVIPLAFVLKVVSGTRRSLLVAVAVTALGPMWVGLGLAHVLLLRGLPGHGRLAVFTVVLATFGADTLAYFTGVLVGRHKLAPTLSPGKTWEGLVGGTIAAVLIPFFALYHQHFLGVGESIVLGVVIAAAAPLGDLFESAIKRDMDVKDSGTLLAGHGGVLDRLDAPLFAAIASYYAIRALAG